ADARDTGAAHLVAHEPDVLRHELGHEAGLPAVRCRRVGTRALERNARPERDTVAGRMAEDVVEHAEIEPVLHGERRPFRDGAHLRGVHELVAELHDLSVPGAAGVHDEAGERLQRGASSFEDRAVAADMTVSVPASAPAEPPDNGASRYDAPVAVTRACCA